MDWASSMPVVPSASSRVEPSGRPTEMTPGIVHPFLLSRPSALAPGPDTVRGPPRVLDHLASRPSARRAGCRRTVDQRSAVTSTPRRRAPSATDRPAVASSSSARRAAGVSRSSSSAARTAANPAAPPPSPSPAARCATAPGGPPPPACPRRCASPSPGGSGAPAGRAAQRPGPTPCRGRPRRRGCRATWTSWSRPGPPGPTWNQSRTKGCAGHRLGLRRLALVVREHEVAAAAVDVDRLAELTQHQGGALDVPPGSSRAPARLPRRLVGQRRLPEHEVERVALVGVAGVAAVLGGQLQHVVPVVAADPPELGEAWPR